MKKLRILTLLTTGLDKPDVRLEEADLSPRASLYERELGTDMAYEEILGRAPAFRRFFYRMMPTVFAQCLETFIIRKRYDVIVSWSDPHALMFASMLRFTHTKMPHVAMMCWISKPKKARILKHVHSKIDTLVLWTSAHRDFAVNELGIPASKIAFIRYFVDQKFWRPIPQHTDMICSAGVEMRDYPTLIAALRELDIPCHIAAGIARGKLFATVTAIEQQGVLPENLTVGRLSAPELRAMYARSRFVVIPLHESESDNGLTVLLEAMAMGKAVICSRIKGQVDVIQDGISGMFVPQGDPKALRDAILYLWNNPEVAERMGQAGRRIIEQHNTWDSFVQNIKSIVEKTYEESGRG